MQYVFPRLAAIASAALLASSVHASISAPAGADARKPAKPAPRTSAEVVRTVRWAVTSGDSRGAPVIVVDKRRARVHVFEPKGRLVGSSPVLLGLAKGDHTVPGIGDKPLSQIKTEERTTPAGRFVAEPGRNIKGEDIIWVDYDAAVSMHRVRAVNAAERRLERLASPTAADNRISYGCINLPATFYDEVLRPAFADANGIVYVLPETIPAQAWFDSYDVDGRAGRLATAAPAAIDAPLRH